MCDAYCTLLLGRQFRKQCLDPGGGWVPHPFVAGVCTFGGHFIQKQLQVGVIAKRFDLSSGSVKESMVVLVVGVA